MASAKKTPRPATSLSSDLLPGITVTRAGWILFAIGLLLYANTFEHGYAQDDAIVISENAFTQKGVEGIAEIFRYDTFRGFFKEAGKATLVAGGRYRPLTLATFAVEVEAFGQNPTVGHVLNAIYYGLTTLILYLLVTLWGGASRAFGFAAFTGLVTAWLFVTHPIHTEAVANIKGRDEIFSLMFCLAALLVAFRSLKSSTYWGHLVAGAVFFLALLSKENALTFVVIAPLAMWFFSGAGNSVIVRASLPWWAAAALMLAIRFSIIPGGGEPSMELMNNPFLKIEDGRWVAFRFGEWSATVMYTLGKYIQLLVFPHPLIHDYYPRHIPIMDWSDWRVIFSFLVCVFGLVYAGIRLPKKDPVSFGILFFFLTLFPVSNILVPIGTNMSERFLFMPSVGFCLVIAVLADQIARSRGKTQKNRIRTKLQRMLLVFGLIGVGFAWKTVDRNRVWKDNLTLFTSDVQHAPNSAKLRNSAGGELIAASLLPENTDRKEAMIREAIGHLEIATGIHPTYKNAYLLLGNAFNYLEQYEQSVESYQTALTLDPTYPDALTNLFLTLRQAGRYYGEQKNDLGRSLMYLRQALELQPEDYETLRLLGIASGISGDNTNAIGYFTRATEVEPENAQAWWNLGNAWYHAGDVQKQQAMHDQARQLDPDIGLKQQQ